MTLCLLYNMTRRPNGLVGYWLASQRLLAPLNGIQVTQFNFQFKSINLSTYYPAIAIKERACKKL